MTQFIASLVVFLALHSVPAIPAIRRTLVDTLGRRLYLALYSLASLLALGWVFYAALQLDYVELWPPAASHAYFPLVLTPIAFFLLTAGLISPNPVSVSFRRGDIAPGAITTITRHPVLWGFALWALGHVVANGDLRSLMLFGIFALFSLFGMVMAERRNSTHPARTTTSVLLFLAIAQGRTRLRFDRQMLVALLVSAVLTGWLLHGGHAVLFGADPLVMTTI